MTESRDTIEIRGLRVFAHHGVFAQERRDGQEFIIDAVVWTDLSRAGASDALGDTIHYGVLAEALAAAAAENPVDLIETLAERLAAVVLSFPAAERTRVSVHKPSAPIPLPFDDVIVTIERTAGAHA